MIKIKKETLGFENIDNIPPMLISEPKSIIEKEYSGKEKRRERRKKERKNNKNKKR